MLSFEAWKEQLAKELGRLFALDGADYIRQTGEDCWRELFNDGLSPSEAALEEWAAAV